MHINEHQAVVAQAPEAERPERLHAEACVHLAHHGLRAAALHGVSSSLAHRLADVHLEWSCGHLGQPGGRWIIVQQRYAERKGAVAGARSVWHRNQNRKGDGTAAVRT